MTRAIGSEGDALVVRISGEFDVVTALELRDDLEHVATENNRKVVVDLAGLRLIDSAGVYAILELYRRVRAQGGSLVVRGLQEQPLHVFRLLRLERVLAGG